MKIRVAATEIKAIDCQRAARPDGEYYFCDDERIPDALKPARGVADTRDLLTRAGISYVRCNEGEVELYGDFRGRNHIYFHRSGDQPAQLLVSDSPFAFAGECPIDWATLKFVPTLRFIPLPLSPVKGTRRLLPGERITFERPSLLETDRENLLPRLLETPRECRRQDVNERIAEVLREATAARVPAAKPPLVFLSGGFDSSLLVHLLRSVGTEPTAWTASFASHLGERETQRAAAAIRHFNVPWRKVAIGAEEVHERLPALIDSMVEPFADVATLAEAVLACHAAKESQEPSVFEGEGMDSLMCGSYKFVAERYRHLLNLLLAGLPAGILGGENRASRVGSLALKVRQLKQVLRGSSPVERHIDFLFGDYRGMDQAVDIVQEARDVFRSYFDLLPQADTLTRLSCMTFFGIIPNLENRKLRLIERYADVRFELVYQDLDFVRLAFALPGTLKVRRGYGKRIVRDVFASELPEAVTGRAKLSFVFPVFDYFGEREIEGLYDSRLVDDQVLGGIIADHRSGKADNLAYLWGLHVASRWAKRYEKEATRAASRD